MKKKVMITGVGGLIGSHLAEALLDQGYSVYGLDINDIDDNKNLDIAKSNQDFFILKVILEMKRILKISFKMMLLKFII